MDEITTVLIKEILDELIRAENKFPYWPEDKIHAAAIVNEESGELIRATIQLQYENGSLIDVRIEAVQTAAMCIRLLKNLYQ